MQQQPFSGVRQLNQVKSDQENQEISDKLNQRSISQKKNLKNSGKWGNEEQNKYTVFLQFFKEELQSKHKRKFNKIFKFMSQYLGTRDAIQCRSHHMKQLRTLKKIKNIIRQTKKRIGDFQYKELYREAVENTPCFKLNLRLLPQQSPTKNNEFEYKQVGIQTNEADPEVNFQDQASQAVVPLVIPSTSIAFPIWPFSQNFFTQQGYY